MTKTETYLNQLPASVQQKFTPLFGDVSTFYQVAYLIVRNEHYLSLNPNEQSGINQDIIRMLIYKLKDLVKPMGLDGKKIMNDIHLEYMEDYKADTVQDVHIEDARFLEIVQHISTL